ncbi:MAG: D-glycero-beta-D-manno-heptose 1,7-bisphosphate 7-phosphatase [Pigmentiphaga sp.]|nr:D-glycero-beta-D-manno-heptose 1,7-bisphosphate 7-phosphatase [Pigmentiphaga sp.]
MKLVILDRDGVINQDSRQFVKTADEWIALPGSLAAIAQLNRAGWRVVVASNQSGLGRGLFGITELNAMHAKLRRELAREGGQIDAFFICPHVPDAGCTCRKPLPGLFHDIARRYDTPLDAVPAVGDSLRDAQAAASAGAQPLLVRTGNGCAAATHPDLPPHTQVFDDLAAVAQYLESR